MHVCESVCLCDCVTVSLCICVSLPVPVPVPVSVSVPVPNKEPCSLFSEEGTKSMYRKGMFNSLLQKYLSEIF